MTQPRNKIYSIPIASQYSLTDVEPMPHDNQQNSKTGTWKATNFIDNVLKIDFGKRSNGLSALNSIKAVLFVVFSHIIYLMVPNQDVVMYPSYWPELILHVIFWAVISIFFHYLYLQLR